jgi:hypothetical protein
MVPSLWRVNPQNASWNLQLPRPKQRCLRDWVRIRAEISGLAAGPDVTSPSAVARQLNIDLRLFRQRIGVLAMEMRERAKLQWARRFEKRVAQFTLRSIEQRNVRQRSAQRPACRRIAEAIRLSRSSKVFRASWERSLKVAGQSEEK